MDFPARADLLRPMVPLGWAMTEPLHLPQTLKKAAPLISPVIAPAIFWQAERERDEAVRAAVATHGCFWCHGRFL